MNFMQPQRQSSSRSPIPVQKNLPREAARSDDGSLGNGGNARIRSVDDNQLQPRNYADAPLKRGSAEGKNQSDDASVTRIDWSSHEQSKCSKPPISNFDNSDDNDAGSDGSGSSQRARRRQLRELAMQSDDCWEANLSDDEKEALPLQWNASMVRRQMMRRQSRRKYHNADGNGVEGMLPEINTQHTPTKSRSDGVQNDESLQSNQLEEMSLPEQLLQKRLRRKERLHRKHEQFMRYQKASHQQNDAKAEQLSHPVTSNNNVSTPPVKKNSISHLTGNKSDVRVSSPLFLDEEFDDDNASTVASSNGGSNDYSRFRSTRTKSRHEQSDSEKIMSPSAASASSRPLHSVPQRPICPFPDEADRKRIVGCLAGILASAYPHETAPHLLVKKKKIGKGTPIAEHITYANSDAYQSRMSTEGGDNAMESNVVMDESFDIPASSNMRSSFDAHDVHQNNGEGDRENPDQSWDVANGTAVHPKNVQNHQRQQNLIQQSKSRSPTKSNSFTAFKDKSHSSSNIYATKPTPASNPRASLQHSFSFASFNNNNSTARIFDKPASQHPPTSLTTELAEIRHRIRRHAILSDLLISSAEMLMLDSSHAKAFLPMLETLLTKVEVPKPMDGSGMDRSSHSGVNYTTAGRQSWKGRGFGGGGVPHPNFCDENIAASSATSQSTSSSVHGQQQTALPLDEGLNKSSNNTDLKSISEKSICEEEGASQPCTNSGHMEAANTGDLFEPFSSSTNHGHANEKQAPCSSPTAPSYAPLDTAVVEKDLVAPFLQTLTPGAGFRCIALLLLNHLLSDGRGYDARVRQAFKRLAVIVISHELKVGGILRMDMEDEDDMDALLWGDGLAQRNHSNDNEEFDDADELARLATRKFEAMEHAIAAKLITISGNDHPKESSASKSTLATRPTESRSHRKKQSSRGNKSASAASSPSSSTHGRIALAPKETPLSSQHGISKEQLLRGIKVGTAGAVGATLFALTGGLAAPGIAAGLAAVAGTSAIAAGVSTILSSAAAISTIFGVGGAGLASYKMHRRTKGLTEFNFHKESAGGKDTEAELFSTVCISGWLRDARDFQRPWGVSPSNPRIVDKRELLERFYFIHNPSNVFRVGEILKHWKGRYFQLWRALREKYGGDPSNLFPLTEGPRIRAELTHEEGEAVDFLLDELGYFPKKSNSTKTPFLADEKSESKGASLRPKSSPSSETKKLQSAQKELKDSSLKPKKWLPEGFSVNGSEIASNLSLFSESETNSINDNSTHTVGSEPNAPSKGSKTATDAVKKTPPKHLLTVWDYHANYGGELYTVQWESELLMELCDSVTDQMIEWGISATKTILHTTVFATLMTAVTLPYSLVLAANAIDSSWTMAMERADRAGVELAKSLIDSTAGHRPVILAGFSMGARVIYSCLKELARHQEIWEAHQQKKQLPTTRWKQSKKEEGQGEDKLKYIREPASIVEDAILMGTPNHVSLKSWEACRRVVAGRLINCYSRKDLILSLMFQMKRFQGILRPVCGTSPVAINGVENYDVTDLVSAHTDYCLVSGEILRRVRHGQPQTASESKTEVSAMVTTINVANKDIGGFASLSDETAAARGR